MKAAASSVNWTRLLALLGIAGWISSIGLWAYFIWVQQFAPRFTWLIDWHVYAAAAQDLVAGDLYRVPLVSAFSIPIDAFNYPPLAAAVACLCCRYPISSRARSGSF